MRFSRFLQAAVLCLSAPSAVNAQVRLAAPLGRVGAAPVASVAAGAVLPVWRAAASQLAVTPSAVLPALAVPQAAPVVPISAVVEAGPAALSVLSRMALPVSAGASAAMSGPVFDGVQPPPAGADQPTPELLERLRAVSLMPSSPEAFRTGLLGYINVAQDAVASGRWAEIRGEADAKLSLLLGMLEFLETALAKEVKPCGECVSKRSCSKVNSGKACPGCVSSVEMDLAQTQDALRVVRALAEHMKAPTVAGLKVHADRIGSSLRAKAE